ncbi:MAG TPA: amidohydrolase [Candidatus Rokubacteria bacterium]|nr:MAG: amidohydrolase [Candidatus Rokubacteria bacterium GWA2_73_35]HBH04604.1 amidohydrolase [Candidatus Rokubacteria bacterium]
MKTSEILAEAHDLLDDTIQLRRRIHRHPEVGLALPRTQATVLEALDGLGLTVETGRRTTSVVARLAGARPGPTILLRADMDALPMREETGLPFASEVEGAMHACGHDAHVAMLVGAARLLARRRATLGGAVLFMFQPGEEGYHGARVMLEEGLLDGAAPPAGAFALHVTHRHAAGVVATRPGPTMASGDTIQIVVRGRGGHASAPHDCLDPVPVACEIVQAFQTLVTRRVNVFDPAVLTIARIEAGTTRNVIPETASLLGTVRTVSEATRERVLEGVRRVAEGVAAAHGAEVGIELIRGYPVTVNDADFAGFVLDTAGALLGPERAHAMSHPVMGSEDFSYVLQRVPGAMANLGTRPENGPVFPNHSNRMLVNESALATGIAMHVAVALRFLARAGAREA